MSKLVIDALRQKANALKAKLEESDAHGEALFLILVAQATILEKLEKKA